MKEFIPTHIGRLIGDARSGGKQPWTPLRETPNYWVTKHGTKYKKSTGWKAGEEKWFMWSLDIETIKLYLIKRRRT